MSIQVSETKLFDVVFAEISYSRECLQLLNMDILWNAWKMMSIQISETNISRKIMSKLLASYNNLSDAD
jgi:hypothetical protein